MDLLYRLYERYPHVCTDSRNAAPGVIFFALRGTSFDGNRFALAALDAGAAVAVVDDPAVIAGADDIYIERLILVEDTLLALQSLAARHRRELGIPILAITGTNGKTTTKELTSRVLSQRYNVAATEGNLNNHIGVPLTILAMGRAVEPGGMEPSGVELGIVEMGAGACGEIELLCNIAQPDFGIITNVGLAHLEGFGSADGVRRGKGELYDYLAQHGGTAFYAQDDPVLSEMIAERPGLQSVGYPYALGEGIPSALVGEYNIYNIAAAVEIGRYFDVPDEMIRQAVESYEPRNRRSQYVETGRNSLILDCYNANPSSMRAALENFAALSGKPKVAILGDMLELGPGSAEYHSDILALLSQLPIDKVLLVGQNFSSAASGSGHAIFPDSASLHDFLESDPLRESLILLKGSRGIALEKIVDLL